MFMRTDYAQMLEQGTNEATDVHDHSHGLRRFRLHLQPIRLRVLRIHEERGVDRRANVAQVPAAEEGTADRYAETSDEDGAEDAEASALGSRAFATAAPAAARTPRLRCAYEPIVGRLSLACK